MLTQAQRNWSPREIETYAIIASLRKYADWIGYQPVILLTDHKALEYWVKEFVDTPSGPAGRRARWHETLSKFDITVQYVPGKDHIVADAMSRYAYPASNALQDCPWHGSTEDAKRMKEIMEEEFRLFHVKPNQPFMLKTDASGYAIGAVLEQKHEGKLVPVAFFSRVLTQAQRNWSPREIETYAIIASLRKYAGWIGYHPVIFLTDHKALEYWVKEFVDTLWTCREKG